MSMHVLRATLVAILLVVAACDDPVAVEGGPPLNATAFMDPDILKFGDPNAFDSLTVLGSGSAEMFDQRTGVVGTYGVWEFDARFDDGLGFRMQVNAEFDSAAAVGLAESYADRIGFLPTVLRAGLDTVWVHDGSGLFSGVGATLLLHVDEAEEYRLQGALEEVLAHEAVHISLDATHANAPGWLAAQASDQGFISGVARDAPARDDLAETFLVWLAVRWAPDGITEFLARLITSAVPARLEYLDAQDFDMYPLE